MSRMIESGEGFVAAYQQNLARMAESGLDDVELGRDACGVGCIVAIDGKPRREVVAKGIEALRLPLI